MAKHEMKAMIAVNTDMADVASRELEQISDCNTTSQLASEGVSRLKIRRSEQDDIKQGKTVVVRVVSGGSQKERRKRRKSRKRSKFAFTLFDVDQVQERLDNLLDGQERENEEIR